MARFGLIAGPIVALVILAGDYWEPLRLIPDEERAAKAAAASPETPSKDESSSSEEKSPQEPPAPRPPLNKMAAVAALMAIWWLTEAVPIAATALLPVLLFPTLRLMNPSQVAANYGHTLVFLYMGGCMVALAIEESGLHRRVALAIVASVGDSPRRIVAGFMIATSALSMWLSNTATTVMMLPIAASVVSQLGDSPRTRRFGTCLMLCLAYSASVGGIATLIGTPTNVLFAGYFNKDMRTAVPELANEPMISFGGWMQMALPFTVVMLAVTWAVMVFWLFPVGGESFLGGREEIARLRRDLGPMLTAERRMGVIFATTAALWIFREPFPGWGWMPLVGLGSGKSGWVDDATVAIAMALVCFITSSGDGKQGRLLDWGATVRVPWGTLILFGGGLALANGMQVSGLSKFLGDRLRDGLEGLSPTMMATLSAVGMTYLTELTSNVASLSMILPVLARAAQTLGVDARLLMVPATVSASCAFMMPVATPPNAIVYGSGWITMRDMFKAGFWLNLVGVVLVVLFVRLIPV